MKKDDSHREKEMGVNVEKGSINRRKMNGNHRGKEMAINDVLITVKSRIISTGKKRNYKKENTC